MANVASDDGLGGLRLGVTPGGLPDADPSIPVQTPPIGLAIYDDDGNYLGRQNASFPYPDDNGNGGTIATPREIPPSPPPPPPPVMPPYDYTKGISPTNTPSSWVGTNAGPIPADAFTPVYTPAQIENGVQNGWIGTNNGPIPLQPGAATQLPPPPPIPDSTLTASQIVQGNTFGWQRTPDGPMPNVPTLPGDTYVAPQAHPYYASPSFTNIEQSTQATRVITPTTQGSTFTGWYNGDYYYMGRVIPNRSIMI